ncbi:hypothetical protein ACTFIV_009312 [Dictyostelium citrinum]
MFVLKNQAPVFSLDKFSPRDCVDEYRTLDLGFFFPLKDRYLNQIGQIGDVTNSLTNTVSVQLEEGDSNYEIIKILLVKLQDNLLNAAKTERNCSIRRLRF